MIMLLVAAAMAMLLAGCGSSQREDQGGSQGGEREERSSQQTSEPTTSETLVDSCADSGGISGQQEEASGDDVSNGKIAFSRLLTDTNRDIYVVDGEGAHETRLTHTPRSSGWYPAWSPDGQKIAFIKNVHEKSVMRNNTETIIRKESSSLYAMNADGTNKTRLAVDVLRAPSWSPDGGKIAFTTHYQSDLSVINADGTQKVSLITASFAGKSEERTLFGGPLWSPTGNKIAFASQTFDEDYDASPRAASSPTPVDEGLTGIYLINVDGTGLCKLTDTEALAYGLGWSPDGEQMVFYDEDTTNVINTDGSGRKQLARGASAVWSPDGQRIALVNDDSVLAVINTDGSGVVTTLADTTGMTPGTLPAWSPDGENIAFPCPSAHGGERADICVTNADGTELKRISLNMGGAGILTDVSWGSG
jgi:Tol biopolymer transport system component